MQALYILRQAKEELKIEHLANEEKRAAERHEWERQKYHFARQKREDEWDLYKMKMMDEGDLEEKDVPKRRPCDVPPRSPPPSPASQ